MKIRPWDRAILATLLSATTLVALEGCTSAKLTSTPQAIEAPKPGYQGQDVSPGKGGFGPVEPGSRD